MGIEESHAEFEKLRTRIGEDLENTSQASGVPRLDLVDHILRVAGLSPDLYERWRIEQGRTRDTSAD